jgi:hypothetical protein
VIWGTRFPSDIEFSAYLEQGDMSLKRAKVRIKRNKAPSKATYTTPRVIEYGDLGDLTLGGNGMRRDGVGGGMFARTRT